MNGLEQEQKVHELKFPGKTLVLNGEQFRAVTRPAGIHQRIVASAGSGKTTTLTARIAWLIQNARVAPESIVLLTFSRNAANQMKQRLEDLLGPTDIWVGTFHGLARNLLQRYEPEHLQKLYFIDELIYMGVQWLQSKKGIAWSSTIQYIFVDEFQDINESQWKMILAMRHGQANTKVIVVGDDAQNIYTWRGSDVSFILDFHKKFKVVDDQLRMNYRSSSSIVAAANGTLKHIPSLPWKETMIAKKGPGPKPEIHFFWRACDETEWVVKQMEAIRKRYQKWTFAVLSRTNSDLYRIEEVLQAKGLPYRLRDVIDEIHDEKVESRGTLDLVTLHASKGLEWDCVFLVGCNDDCFPAKKSAADIICERRLFYVGVTRARSVLYFTYTNKETALSRFVREIPRIHLTYTGLAKYVLSDYDRAEGKSRLIDILSGLDGNKLQVLRSQGIFQTIERENWVTGQLFPPGLWTIPSWAMGYDRGGDFLRFLRLWFYRHLWKYMGQAEPFREPALERVLFTLRVYAEEREFFEQWQTEVIEMLHTWFGNTKAQDTMPTVDFHEVKAWVLQRGLSWSVDEIVKATTLLAKLRGQLRPLRFDKYDLSEFRIGSARYVVPTESRAEALRSWRAVSDRSKGWREVLGDLWRLGALGLCAEGRNAALYRVIEMSEHLKNGDVCDFLETLETALAPWMIRQGKEIQFGLELANQDIFTDTLDIVAGGTFWKICVEQKMDALAILELAVRGSLARREGLAIDKIGWILPLEGTYVTIEIGSDWDKCVDKLLG